MSQQCPSENLLTQYVRALLADGDAVAITDHLDTCSECEETVSRLERSAHTPIREAAERTRSQRQRRGPNVTTRDFLESLAEGDVIVDCRLEMELGAGSFARVFKARQESTHRIVALKISSRASGEPILLSQLDHRHIVRLHHYDDRSLSNNGVHMLYMQHVAGCSLKEVIESLKSTPTDELDGGKLLAAIRQSHKSEWSANDEIPSPLAGRSWDETVTWIGARLADALDYAHESHVIHRDVKPANILLTANGSPMLVDFNVGFGATIDGAEPEDDFGGSEFYMSPEQRQAFRGAGITPKDVTASTDIYSLAIVLHELATVTQGHEAKTIGSVQADERRQNVEQWSKRFPRTLPGLVEQCFKSDPSHRPSAARVARSLALANETGANELVTFRRNEWRYWFARFPFTAACLLLSVAGLTPNLLNIFLSSQFDTVTNILDPNVLMAAKSFFNAIVLPGGFLVLFSVSWPVMNGVRKVIGEQEQADWQAPVRLAASLGAWYSGITFAGWALTGAIYPVADALYGCREPTLMRGLEYFAYNSLLGMVAAAIVYLLVSAIATRFLLPILIIGAGSPETRQSLRRVAAVVDYPSVILGMAPLAMLVIFSAAGHVNNPELDSGSLLMSLGIVGMVGFGLAGVLGPRIRANVGKLNVLLLSNSELLYGDRKP